MKNVLNEKHRIDHLEEVQRMLLLVRNVLRLTLVTGLLGLLFLGAAVGLSGCTVPPDQPDLNTYGAMQPLCVVWCHQVLTVSEGDGATAALSTTVSETLTTGRM